MVINYKKIELLYKKLVLDNIYLIKEKNDFFKLKTKKAFFNLFSSLNYYFFIYLIFKKNFIHIKYHFKYLIHINNFHILIIKSFFNIIYLLN